MLHCIFDIFFSRFVSLYASRFLRKSRTDIARNILQSASLYKLAVFENLITLVSCRTNLLYLSLASFKYRSKPRPPMIAFPGVRDGHLFMESAVTRRFCEHRGYSANRDVGDGATWFDIETVIHVTTADIIDQVSVR